MAGASRTPGAAAVLARLKDYTWGTALADRMLVRSWTRADGWDATPSIMPYSPVPIYPAASVLHYGMSVFEGMKAYAPGPGADAERHRRGGLTKGSALQPRTGSAGELVAEPPLIARIFRPDLHARRMNRSAARQALPTMPPERFVEDAALLVRTLKDWVPTEAGSALYLRPVLFATQCAIGIRRSDEALFMMLAVPVPMYFSKPVRLLAEDHYVRSWPGGVGDCKTAGNYALSVTPAELAMEKGFTQIVWLDGTPKRNITESGVMNFIAVIASADNPARLTVVTPPTSGLILQGVTRQSVLDLARSEFSHVMDVEERDFSIDEFTSHAESGRLVDCFGTGTAATVSPIHSITVDGHEHVIPRRSIAQLGGTVAETFRKRIMEICHSNHPWSQQVRDVPADSAREKLPKPVEAVTERAVHAA
jgi:branched-chain amino acid aminotransferase